MAILARALGDAQLAEPQRFSQEWERGASFALRAGSLSVLGEYDQRGRLQGGSHMAEQATRACRAEYPADGNVVPAAARRT
jgi:hypothetical protein